MNKKFWLIYAIAVFICSPVYAFDLFGSSEDSKVSNESVTTKTDTSENNQTVQATEPEQEADKTTEAKAEPIIADDFTDHINMSKWLYNEEDEVFYQLGITYCRYPEDTKYEKIALFIPDEYMKCTPNNDNTSTYKLKLEL